MDYVLNAPKEEIRYDVLQSERAVGFREQNRNMIVEVGKDFRRKFRTLYLDDLKTDK